ncbi:flagellar protein FlgN [Noviherbaspirillum cavernae]|uniref:Flagellar protein FlgN n=1 Tax=Noviherbaspirillum cavernae TaxID=2320862 RepID=A0A418WVH8_9BURK|nr:flagellar export chaperone FlgN [Noviherbaspirillum cavernae]RJF96696.1 flagellar protein FlgN [Noviherbaspirillum cavernae]
MTRKDALARLLRGVGEDVRDYRELQAMLEEQFMAALRYETARLNDVAERITTLVETLELRRAERVALVTEMLGEGASMSDTFPLLTRPAREALEAGWQTLEELVRECKEHNARNCNLLMDQHGIMQRVLHGEEQIYAPV